METGKKAAAKEAVCFVKKGMILGLGTGTTSEWFIRFLAESPIKNDIQAIASSRKSLSLAQELEIPLLLSDNIVKIDLTVDGADEIDKEKRMIKGGGGALLREKIQAASSEEMVVIVDSSKRVDFLGKFSLPVEISTFAFQCTLLKIFRLGYKGNIRKEANAVYVTDNGNYILDLNIDYPCHNPEEVDRELKAIPGVLETGFFYGIEGRVVGGYED